MICIAGKYSPSAPVLARAGSWQGDRAGPGFAVPAPLPVDALREEIVAALGTSSRLVLEAPTGSGKSTRVPGMILDAGLAGAGEVVVLQPRRLAARLLARRVAQERGGELGGEVGYAVRFERALSRQTRIRFVTDGVLLRELGGNPTLRGVGAVVLDEFHERHLDAELGLALLRRLQERARPDLKLVLMSATLDGAELATALEPCARVRSEGRSFPVAIHWQEARPREELAGQVARAAREALAAEPDGHLLVFLPGTHEIRKAGEALRRLGVGKRAIHELHGAASVAQQDAATAPGGPPRIILATNVAETSITIDGVTAVIDSGLARESAYDPRRGVETLLVRPISRASADQRAGRAGRTAPGRCWRLWSQAEHSRRAGSQAPELLRSELADAWLALRAGGVHRPLAELPWLVAPPPEAVKRAEDLLAALELVEPDGRLTPRGSAAARLGLPPREAVLLLEGAREGVLEMAADAAALWQGRPLLKNLEPLALPGDDSDLQPLLRALAEARAVNFDRARLDARGTEIHAAAAREADRLARTLVSRMRRLGGERGTAGEGEDGAEAEVAAERGLERSLLAAFADRLAVPARAGSKAWIVAGGRRAVLDGATVLRKPELVVAGELIEIGGRELELKLGLLTEVRRGDLDAVFPGELRQERATVWDAGQRRAVGVRRTVFRDLVLEEKGGGEPDPREASALLAAQIVGGRERLPLWNEKVERWLARLALVRQYAAEHDWPEWDEEQRALVVEELAEGETTLRGLQQREVLPVLAEWLGPQRTHLLERLAPDEVKLDNGRKVRVRYAQDEPPTVAVLMRHLFGARRTPTVVDGRLPLRVEVLAPNQRPQQVTSDLEGFWERHWPGLRAELSRRYPKHPWPEDGAKATPA